MRTLWIRILTAIVGIPLFVASVLLGKWTFFALIEILIIGTTIEFAMLFRRLKWSVPLGPLLLINVALPASIVWSLPSPAFIAILWSGIGISAALLLRHPPSINTVSAFTATLAGFLYIGISFSLLLHLHTAADIGSRIILALFGSIWISDSAAYFIGKWWGKRKLAPHISPNKTWEGATAGFIAAILSFSLLGIWLLPSFPFYHWIALGSIVGFLGPIGDLTESMFKRAVDVKDSSQFFPGHGGFLDRFDSTLFCVPPTFIYTWFILLQ